MNRKLNRGRMGIFLALSLSMVFIGQDVAQFSIASMNQKSSSGYITYSLVFAGSNSNQSSKRPKSVGSSVKSGAREVGHSIRDGAKSVGHSFKRGGKTVGHSFKRGAKSVGHFFRDVFK